MDPTVTAAVIAAVASVVVALVAGFSGRARRRRSEQETAAEQPSPPTGASQTSGRDQIGQFTAISGNDNYVSVSSAATSLIDSDLELVRVDFLHGSDGDRFPMIDVTLRNMGQIAAVIHEFVVNDAETWEFPAPVSPSAMPVSWTFDVDLGRSREQRHRISQVVEGQGADRFAVRLGTSVACYPFVGAFLYTFRASLTVNASRSQVELGHFLVSLPQPMTVMGTFSPGLSRDDARHLKSTLSRLRDQLTDDTFIDERAREALSEIDEISDPEDDAAWER
jgi:hypothetical protein